MNTPTPSSPATSWLQRAVLCPPLPSGAADLGIHPVQRLVYGPLARTWCSLPYPGHRHGCPNVDKKETCPGAAPFLPDVFDLERPLWLVIDEFDLAGHVEKMRERHPHWTARALRNVLYWQGTSKARCRQKAKQAVELLGADLFTLCPEAMGLHVYATAASCGIRMERIRDLKTCRRTALVGFAACAP